MRVSLIRGWVEDKSFESRERHPLIAERSSRNFPENQRERGKRPVERELRPRLFSVAKICRYGFFVARELIMNNDLCLVCAGIGVFL